MHKTLTVGEAFKPAVRGKAKYSRTYIRSYPGEYPVFSASIAGPLGHIDSFEFDGEYLSWTTNGYAGRTMVLSGRFSCTSDRAVLDPKLDGLDLDYCSIVLAPKFEEAARGRRQDGPRRDEYTKLPPAEVSDIEFEVPCDENGRIDAQAQHEFVERWRRSTAFQRRAMELSTVLERATVLPSFDEITRRSEVHLMDTNVFKFLRNETGWFKKDWVNLVTHDGSGYPVFSAAKSPVAMVSISTSKLIDASPENRVLSFAVDGEGSAGTNFVLHDTPFYVSTNRATFVSVRDDIDLEYVYYALQAMKADYGFGFGYKAYAAHLQDVVIVLPIDDDGLFHLEEQRAQVERIRELYRLRQEVCGLLREVSSARLSIA